MIFIHQADDSDFVAQRAGGKSHKPRKRGG
jgi:hypothetical protein